MDKPEHKPNSVLRKHVDWSGLHFYQKAETLYRLTYIFCQRFLPRHGDRTIDQMVQAARSGKQNIVEGIEAGTTSSDSELKLLNVARASLQELRVDYKDYLHTRELQLWDSGHPRFEKMLHFCREHNLFEDYEPYAGRWEAEEFCNTAITLCHITDRMLSSFLKGLEKRFVEQGGIKERMHAARTGYRQAELQELHALRAENAHLRAEVERLKGLLKEKEEPNESDQSG